MATTVDPVQYGYQWGTKIQSIFINVPANVDEKIIYRGCLTVMGFDQASMGVYIPSFICR